MHLILKSALSRCQKGIPSPGERPKLLLLYQDGGFVNTTMELLRIAAGKVQEDIPLFCAIWDFDVVTEPLLMKVAVREMSAADMVIVVLHSGHELPISAQKWLSLWRWAHRPRFLLRRGFDSNCQCFGWSPATFDCEVEDVGELGDMNLLAMGGCLGPALAAFKSELALALAFQIRRPAELVARFTLSGPAARGKGFWRYPRAACSGYQRRFLC